MAPQDRAELKVQIGALCLHWRRWYAMVQPEKAESGQATVKDLRADLQRAVAKVNMAIQQLQSCLDKVHRGPLPGRR